VKKISSHTHKTGSWYLLGVLFKISDELPTPFYMGDLPLGVKVLDCTSMKFSEH